MLITKCNVVPIGEIVPVFGMLAEVTGELAIAERFVISFGERVGYAKGGEPADVTNRFDINDDN